MTLYGYIGVACLVSDSEQADAVHCKYLIIFGMKEFNLLSGHPVNSVCKR